MYWRDEPNGWWEWIPDEEYPTREQAPWLYHRTHGYPLWDPPPPPDGSVRTWKKQKLRQGVNGGRLVFANRGGQQGRTHTRGGTPIATFQALAHARRTSCVRTSAASASTARWRD